jgi:hypothetical protein
MDFTTVPPAADAPAATDASGALELVPPIVERYSVRGWFSTQRPTLRGALDTWLAERGANADTAPASNNAAVMEAWCAALLCAARRERQMAFQDIVDAAVPAFRTWIRHRCDVQRICGGMSATVSALQCAPTAQAYRSALCSSVARQHRETQRSARCEAVLRAARSALGTDGNPLAHALAQWRAAAGSAVLKPTVDKRKQHPHRFKPKTKPGGHAKPKTKPAKPRHQRIQQPV